MTAPFKSFALAAFLLSSGVSSFSPFPSRIAVSPIHRVNLSRVRIALHATDEKNFLDETKDCLIDCEKSVTDKLATVIKKADQYVVKPFIRVGNHVPTFLSLAYFGLISMAMTGMKGADAGRATLASVLTSPLGPTTSAQFSSFFPTLVTPPPFIFLVWPLIAATQLFTAAVSSIRGDEPLLSQRDLTTLSLANVASATWLVTSSGASAGTLPIASVLLLPLVPCISGVHLRAQKGVDAKKATLKNFVFQLYSSFTTVASLLALAVELQHGGRIPILKGQAEVAALVFLALFGFVVRLPGQGEVKRYVHVASINGILFKRLFTGGITSVKDLLSVSLLGTVVVAVAALLKLRTNEDEDADDKWEDFNDTWEKESKISFGLG